MSKTVALCLTPDHSSHFVNLNKSTENMDSLFPSYLEYIMNESLLSLLLFSVTRSIYQHSIQYVYFHCKFYWANFFNKTFLCFGMHPYVAFLISFFKMMVQLIFLSFFLLSIKCILQEFLLASFFPIRETFNKEETFVTLEFFSTLKIYLLFKYPTVCTGGKSNTSGQT